MMIKPDLLKKGDKVALISLSGGLGGEDLFRHRVELGKKRLEEVFGLEVVITPNALKGCEYLSSHPESKAEDLHWALKDDSIKAIFSIIGGNDSDKIVPYVNIDEITKHPKIFCGFSDSTIIHFLFYKAGVQSFYGPAVMCQFAENVKMHDYTVQAIQNALFSNEPYEIKSADKWCGHMLDWSIEENDNIIRPMNDETHGIEFLMGDDTQGELIGGCIDTFPRVKEAKLFDNVNWDNKILFIEPSDDTPTPEEFLGYLELLKSMDVFTKINGIIVGKPKFEKYYNEYKQTLIKFLNDNNYNLTVVYNVNFGHEDPITILPYEAKLIIDTKNKKILVNNN